MIKLLVFDYDGVLASLREVHYQALNKALENVSSDFVISNEEHIRIYDGLTTRTKLDLLIKNKSFPSDKVEQVFADKQKYTMEMIPKFAFHDSRLFSILTELKKSYKLYIASNAIRATVEEGILKIGISHLFDKIISNEDVVNKKPHPEIYFKAMSDAGVDPSETLIIEDSKHGREAAAKSGAFVCGVDCPEDVSLEKINNIISYANSKPSEVKWQDKNMNVLIPMSGLGSRFAEKGYKLPKPLIDVNGKPMIQRVVENLNIDANYIFVVQAAHYEQYNLGVLLPLIAPGCIIVQVNGITEGAACSTLLAKEFIDNDQHLLIANSDQILEWDSCGFMWDMISSNVDGGLLTFRDTDPKWSFSKINDDGYVIEVAEKNPISDIASTGIYYFKYGKDYVKYAEQMIGKELRYKNEFYICPVYNEFIGDNKRIKIHDCKKMHGVGTPADLESYLENCR